jgi:Xaa-Pro aminopeptidase
MSGLQPGASRRDESPTRAAATAATGAAALHADDSHPAGPVPVSGDRGAKRERVLRLLDARGADSLVLRSHGAVAWYLDGARTHVSLAGDPVVAVVVDRSGDEIRVFQNEADRLRAEELGADDLGSVHEISWHEPLIPAGLTTLDEADVAAELRAARASLLPAERERYRRLGRETAEVLTAIAHRLDPDWTERRVAAALAAGLTERAIDPLVVLVAGTDRIGHRHPLPTDGPVGRRAMLVVCGRRHGLIANATRWVVFGQADASGTTSARSAPHAFDRASGAAPTEASAEERLPAVEAAFLDATVPGATLDGVFAAGIAAYAANGFDADEWRRHHQGGAAGYVGRDPRAVPGVTDMVQAGQAFAWNPSAPGAKVEDTIVRDAGGFEVLTFDPAWPTVDVAGRRRPVALRR